MITDSLESRIYSAFPIIKIDTEEEPRLLAQLRGVAQRTNKGLITWSIASGMQQLEKPSVEWGKKSNSWSLSIQRVPEKKYKDEAVESSNDPEAFLKNLAEGLQGTIVVLLDFHPYFEKPAIIRLLKELAFTCEKSKSKIVLMSHNVDVPAEIASLTQAFEVTLPTMSEISKLVDQEAALFKIRRKNETLKIDETAKSLLVNNLVGVNTSDALRLIRNAIYMDNAITASDVPEIKKAKYDLISHSGALTFEYDTSSFGQIGGFKNLKTWVKKRKNAILENGKSLAARALAGQLGIPLIRLDFGSLFNKYVGESEKNVREALHSAEVMSPCVLWIDELEKSITSSGSDNTGSSSRILSYLLNWMQENKAGTFVVATANDISSLPPELIRKGRIDEIFFVDLPTHSIREDIIRSVLLKRGLEPDTFALDKIAHASDGFSGAEIEQAIVSSLYHTEHLGAPLCADSIMHEMAQTQPLSVVRAESIAELRHWAADRTVPVDAPDGGSGRAKNSSQRAA